MKPQFNRTTRLNIKIIKIKKFTVNSEIFRDRMRLLQN